MKLEELMRNRKLKGGGKGKHRKPEEFFDLKEADARISEFFYNHGFEDFPQPERLQLVRFYQMLMANQQEYNFTRLLRIRDVAIKHFVDCLMVPKLTQLVFPLLDVGTGPGFPGIPLKIVYPDERIILCEGVQKRVEFLKNVREELELKNLDILGRRMDKTFEYPVQGIITRALANISESLELFLPSLPVGGFAYFMKGPNVDQEVFAAESKFSGTYKLSQNISYQLPETPHQRRLVIFEKTAPRLRK